jgi:hypothetical protein
MPTSLGVVLTALGPSLLPLTPGQLLHPETNAMDAATLTALSSAMPEVKRRDGDSATGVASNID